MQAFSVIKIDGEYDELMQTGRPPKHQRLPFGERLATLREQAGLSQRQLADKLRVTQQMIAYWERRSTCLRPEHLIALADALNTSVDELLGKAAPRIRGGPVGKVRQVFEAVSRLPRRQQKKIAEVVNALVAQSSNGHKQAA